MECKDCAEIDNCYCRKRCGICYKDPERTKKKDSQLKRKLLMGWCQVCKEEQYSIALFGY